MDNQKDPTSTFLNMLSDIKDQLFHQKQQTISLTEQMIQSKDLSYIPQILSCFPIKNYLLSELDADMHRLSIICEIVAAEERLFDSRIFFLEGVLTFDDLLQKYMRITFLLRRIEFHLPEEALEETILMLMEENVSICAIRKITENEIFADGERVYRQTLNILGGI